MNHEPTTFSSVLWKFRRWRFLYWVLSLLLLYLGLTVLSIFFILALMMTSHWYIEKIERIENEHHE